MTDALVHAHQNGTDCGQKKFPRPSIQRCLELLVIFVWHFHRLQNVCRLFTRDWFQIDFRRIDKWIRARWTQPSVRRRIVHSTMRRDDIDTVVIDAKLQRLSSLMNLVTFRLRQKFSREKRVHIERRNLTAAANHNKQFDFWFLKSIRKRKVVYSLPLNMLFGVNNNNEWGNKTGVHLYIEHANKTINKHPTDWVHSEFTIFLRKYNCYGYAYTIRRYYSYLHSSTRTIYYIHSRGSQTSNAKTNEVDLKQ